MIRFENPKALYLLLVLIIPAIAAIARFPKLLRLLRLFPPSRRSLADGLRFRYGVSVLFSLISAGCLITALAGPSWGSRLVPEPRRGTELVLALDLSRSMDVRDMADQSGASRSRLEAGAALAGVLVAASPEIRFGIALGKGSGVLALPLTDDREAALAFLEGLSTSLITGRGTNLEALLDAAAGAFEDGFPARREILLFSDGEALSGALSEALERAAARGITVSAVGLGAETGGIVPAAPGEAETVSVLHREVLQNAASMGIYLDGNSGHSAARLLEYAAGPSVDGFSGGAAGFRRESEAQWRVFALAALCALGIAEASGKVWRRGGRRRKAGKGLLLSLAAALLAGSCSPVLGKLYIIEGSFLSARGHSAEAMGAYLKALAFPDAAPYAEYGLGCVYLALDEGQAAQKRFAAALSAAPAGDTELIYRIRYNLGVIHFQNGGFEAAAQEFRRALEAESGKIEAKRNLELSLLSQGAREQSSAAPVFDGDGGEYGALFDLIRRKERDRWKNREWTGTADYTGPDY